MPSLLTRNGTYYAQFHDARRIPKTKRLSLGTKRKREARKRLVELEQDWESGKFDPWQDDPSLYSKPPLPESSLNLSDALNAFLAEKQKQGRSKSTIDNYRSFCDLLVRSVGSQKPLRSLSVNDIESYVLDDSVALTSRGTRYRHVRAWLRWCAKQGLMKSNIIEEVTSPQTPDKMPKVIRKEDLEAIESAIRDDYKEKRERGAIKKGELIWMVSIFWFGFYSGLRSSEIARLRWGHIDFEHSLIRIYQQKNGKQQTVPLTTPARKVLERLPAGAPDDFVFLAPGSDPHKRNVKSFRCNLARKFKHYKNEAGIDRRITPHGLRHGFCTALAEAGKSAATIKQAARHADIQTSMRYVHLSNEHLKSELEDVFS